MALYKSVTLKFGKALAVFISLASPHADHVIPTDTPETFNEPDVVLEMTFQRGPLSNKHPLHDGDSWWALVRIFIQDPTNETTRTTIGIRVGSSSEQSDKPYI